MLGKQKAFSLFYYCFTLINDKKLLFTQEKSEKMIAIHALASAGKIELAIA